MDTEGGFGAGEKLQYPQAGDCLGDDGGQGGAFDAQIKQEDENGVQNDVDDCTNDHRHHGEGGVALGGNIGIKTQ